MTDKTNGHRNSLYCILWGEGDFNNPTHAVRRFESIDDATKWAWDVVNVAPRNGDNIGPFSDLVMINVCKVHYGLVDCSICGDRMELDHPDNDKCDVCGAPPASVAR